MNKVKSWLMFFAAGVVLAFSSQNGFAESGQIAKQEWVVRYGMSEDTDVAEGLAIDSQGNVVVTGDSHFDYATVKYNSAGRQLWVARYGSDGRPDSARDIAIDHDDNIIVTGKSYRTDEDYDCVTVKYNSSGSLLWAARYEGSYNGRETCKEIAIDNENNIYVTGSSINGDDLDYDEDYITIRYTPDGREVWTARYDGGGIIDSATDIGLDSESNVYVTGQSDGNGTLMDCVTIKYNHENGQELWVARYDGTGSMDIGTDLAFDSEDNVYVSGASIGDGTGYDYSVLKYSPNGGQPIWVARHDEGDDDALYIAVDNQDNIFVTGRSDNDYLTIRYNSDNGQKVWEARDPQGDSVSQLVLDQSGNVYITGIGFGNDGSGNNYVTVKYNPDNGQQLWMVSYSGPLQDLAAGLGVDQQGNVYVTGGSTPLGRFSMDYATIKYVQIPTVTVEVEPLTPIVERGGQAQYTVTLTNNSIEEKKVVEFWSSIKDSDGEWRDAIDPTSVTLESREIRKKTITEPVPLRTPVGDYEYHGFVGPEFDQIWDEDVANFTVTDPRLNF